jgi:hypothetical protein
MKPLHEAVHDTANQLLDKPAFVPLFHTQSILGDETFDRVYRALQPLGYARLNFYSSGDSGLPAVGCSLEVHPLAHAYYKKYGEQYVELLEATRRLTQ